MTAKSQVGQRQERTILIVLAEVVGEAWDVVAERPGTLSPDCTGAVERVEIRRSTIIGGWDERATSTSCAIAAATKICGLDAR